MGYPVGLSYFHPKVVSCRLWQVWASQDSVGPQWFPQTLHQHDLEALWCAGVLVYDRSVRIAVRNTLLSRYSLRDWNGSAIEIDDSAPLSWSDEEFDSGLQADCRNLPNFAQLSHHRLCGASRNGFSVCLSVSPSVLVASLMSSPLPEMASLSVCLSVSPPGRHSRWIFVSFWCRPIAICFRKRPLWVWSRN